MNLRERCQEIFKAGYQFGETSFRRLAKTTKLSKSSVHRLYHRIVGRNQHPESSLWETEAITGLLSLRDQSSSKIID